MQQNITEFPALGTTVRGVIVGDPTKANDAFRRIRGYIFDFEQRFSRFLVGNELDRLNKSAGHPTTVSPEMLDILEAGRSAFEASHGLVDITVGQDMIGIGYSKSFHLLQEDTRPQQLPPKAEVAERRTFADVQIDIEKRIVTIPRGTRIDLGGIGKGYLLDQCSPIIRRMSTNYWLSLGGDLIVSGHNGYGRPWPVGIQDPYALEKDKKTLLLPVGRYAIAASGTTKRQWTTNTGKKHHIIDPRTGTSTTTDIAMAMVVAPTGLTADVLAKTVVIHGTEHAFDTVLEQPQTSALYITTEGNLQTTPNLADSIFS